MLIHAITAFLVMSLILYCLFAGADFGAGILEFFLTKERKEEQREVISHAIAPVWEANHVWLILAVVILFNGFPEAYSAISTYLHIPLLIMLFGIILRGCAFTFRHYDPIKDGADFYYSIIFRTSSIATPFMIGVLAGAITKPPVATPAMTFKSLYLSPWISFFPFALGLFTCSLFTFLAATYLIGETEDRTFQSVFAKRALLSNIFSIITGALVFFGAEADGIALTSSFISHPVSLGCMVFSTTAILPLWRAILSYNVVSARILAALQVVAILIGWFTLQYPVIFSTVDGRTLTIFNSSAPKIVLQYLLYALIAGAFLIFPTLGLLLQIFKRKEKSSLAD